MRRRRASLAALIVAAIAAPAAAHRVGADALVSDDGTTIRVEAWFSGGVVPQHGTVVVLDPAGNEVGRGDLVEGAYEFRPQRAERYRFVVQFGEGHAATIDLADDQLARLHVAPDAAATAGTDGAAEPGTSATRPADGGAAPTTNRALPSHAGGSASGGRYTGAAHGSAMDLTLRVLVGLAVIASLVALGMARSAGRRIARIEQRLGAREDR